MTSQRTHRLNAWVWHVFTALCFIATAVALAETLRALWAAFMSGGGMGDGVMYTNMMWNSGHGEPFRFYVTDNYLRNHLSFTLVPLGYLFRIWDHPFLLYALQWFLLLGGGLTILVAAAFRLRISRVAVGAVALFFVGYVLTQRVMLSAFHGSHTYYLLIPWLYYTLRFRKIWAIPPLVLLLGIREDAFLVVLPILAHAAWRDRSIGASSLLCLAILYGVFAMTWLFPHINGVTITERRSEISHLHNLFATWHDRGLRLRGMAFLLWAPPLIVFTRKKASAVWLYPSIPILISLFSGFWRQYGLLDHYPASVMATMAVGIVEGTASARARLPVDGRDTTAWRAVALVGLTIAAHIPLGILRTGAYNSSRYQSVHPETYASYHTAKFLPKTGILLTDLHLAPFCANRRDLLTWRNFNPEKHSFDLLFTNLKKIGALQGGEILQGIRDGTYGVIYCDNYSIILQRGAAMDKNAGMLDAYDSRARTLLTAYSASHVGDNVFEPNVGFVRYWPGDGSRGPANISHGDSLSLSAGRYNVTVRYRAGQPRRTVRDSWGVFAVFPRGQSDAIAEAPVEKIVEPDNGYREQLFEFTNPAAGLVEFRVDAADAPLWVLSARFDPIE